MSNLPYWSLWLALQSSLSNNRSLSLQHAQKQDISSVSILSLLPLANWSNSSTFCTFPTYDEDRPRHLTRKELCEAIPFQKSGYVATLLGGFDEVCDAPILLIGNLCLTEYALLYIKTARADFRSLGLHKPVEVTPAVSCLASVYRDLGRGAVSVDFHYSHNMCRGVNERYQAVIASLQTGA